MYSYKARFVQNRKRGRKEAKSLGDSDDYRHRSRDDDYSDLIGADQFTDEERDDGRTKVTSNSVGEHRAVISKPHSKRGKLITFYRNGDAHYKGLKTSISQKQFQTLEALLAFLSQKISTITGVRHVFSWPEGREVLDMKDFEADHAYVVSSVSKLDSSIDYGRLKDQNWTNKKPSAGKLRETEVGLSEVEKKAPTKGGGQPVSKARVLTIVSNTDRSSREKVILNPQTNQTFEEILEDIGNMIRISRPPVTALFTFRKPHKKVVSFSQLFRDFKDHDAFIACGREGHPARDRKDPPSSTQSDTAIAVSQRQRRPANKVQNLKEYSSDYDGSPVGAAPTPSPRLPAGGQSIFHKIVAPPHVTDGRGWRGGATSPVNEYRRRPDGRGVSMLPVPHRNHGADGRSHAYETVKVDVHGRRREFYVPTTGGKAASDGRKPEMKLRVDWVYGYRGRDARCNLYVLPSGELLYYVASVAVIYDKVRDTQRHYLGHNEDITSMVLHPNENCVATGQATGFGRPDTGAHVRIWDARTLATYAIIGFGVFQVAVGCLAFSTETDGACLLVIDESSKHVLSLWTWQEERMLAKVSLVSDDDRRAWGGSSDAVAWGIFHPFDDRIIVTYGKQHLHFWKLFNDGSSPTRIVRDKSSGLFEEDPPKFVTSVCFSRNGDLISGDSNGSITVWGQAESGAFVPLRRATHMMRHAHKKSVFALHMMKDGTLLSGGGLEIKAWDSLSNFRHMKSRSIPDSSGFVRTLVAANDARSSDAYLYVGTTRNCIIEGTFGDRFRYLLQGHSGELWALATHPEEHSFVTAGYDQQVCKWSAVSHKMQWCAEVDKPCLSVAYDGRGRLLVVGTDDGRFTVLDAHTGSHLASIHVGTGAVDSTKFSPDGHMLAMGSQDGNIYVYDVVDGGQFFRKHKEGVLPGHKNFVMQLDWSEDSRYLQSVSGDYDLVYWDTYDMRQERNARAMRDVTWDSQSCVLGYCVTGAWSLLENEDEDINVVCKSSYEDYLAVGDNQGAIRLFKYPASTHRPDYIEKKHYSSHVTNLKFMFDDSYIVSTGGIDAGLMQWSFTEGSSPR